MTLTKYVNSARRIIKSSKIFDPDPASANLVVEVPTGQPVANIQLNQHGSIIVYLHIRARDDRNPTAVYQDGSDDVFFPLKGRLQLISDSAEIMEGCDTPTEHDVNPESRLYPDFDSALLLWPGQQLRSTYNGRSGIFVPMISLPHPYDLSGVAGLRINGSWKQSLS
jgi:hypothetical protein